ncbi:MAG: tRNA pseudouridine(55) synthase TruB [Rickettsiales bacterium]|nr:tRNA pseudouridine(55) synthase TruB [Rickettsiales bacterium]
MYHGWLNVDKPEGMTSADMVSVMRRVFSMKKIGHAGTLDPMATGVLPLAFGEATKTVRFMQELNKEYYFTVKFGAATDSFDRLGKVTKITESVPSFDLIQDILKFFIGEIDQVPPKFSAIMVNGVRAYKKARQGEDLQLSSRKIRIFELDLLSFSADVVEAEFRVVCSKGTYVRSLGHDIALKLGSLGHLTALRRSKVGNFDQNNIKSIEKVKEMVHNEKIRLLSVDETFSDVPFINFSVHDEEKIRNGVSVKISQKDRMYLNQQEAFAKVGSKLIAIGRIDNDIFCPTRGFNFN